MFGATITRHLPVHDLGRKGLVLTISRAHAGSGAPGHGSCQAAPRPTAPPPAGTTLDTVCNTAGTGGGGIANLSGASAIGAGLAVANNTTTTGDGGGILNDGSFCLSAGTDFSACFTTPSDGKHGDTDTLKFKFQHKAVAGSYAITVEFASGCSVQIP